MCAGSHGAEKFCFNTQRKHSFQRKPLKTPDGVDEFEGQNFAAGEKKQRRHSPEFSGQRLQPTQGCQLKHKTF